MIGRSIRTASRARSSCWPVEPSSSGRSSAFPPKATTASGRTKEKKGVGFMGETADRRRQTAESGSSTSAVCNPASAVRSSRLHVLPHQRHRHAAGSAAGAGELVGREQDHVLLGRLPELEL